MSLITELRAKDLDSVIGNIQVKKILRTIINNPANMPRNIIFSASRGCCKTTLSRIFGYELNKGTENPEKYIMEIDSSNVTRVEDMKELIPYISMPSLSQERNYKVVIFDEAHLISKTAFSQLLKLIEENVGNIFYIFCTTELHKLLDTIRSRSITLYLEGLTKDYMIEYLNKLDSKVFNPEYLQDKELLDILYLHSKGCFRDLIQQIELLNIQGLDLYKSNTLNYKVVYNNIIDGDRESLLKILRKPLVVIEDSWDFFIRNYDAKLDTITKHLQYRDKLHSTTDWFLFFKLISKKEQKEAQGSKLRK